MNSTNYRIHFLQFSKTYLECYLKKKGEGIRLRGKKYTPFTHVFFSQHICREFCRIHKKSKEKGKVFQIISFFSLRSLFLLILFITTAKSLPEFL